MGESHWICMSWPKLTVFPNDDSESSKLNISMAVNESEICIFSDCLPPCQLGFLAFMAC